MAVVPSSFLTVTLQESPSSLLAALRPLSPTGGRHTVNPLPFNQHAARRRVASLVGRSPRPFWAFVYYWTFTMPAKQNWFETLNAALESENLVDLWPCGLNINYGQTVRHCAETKNNIRLISVTRETDGRYERPVFYICGLCTCPCRTVFRP